VTKSLGRPKPVTAAIALAVPAGVAGTISAADVVARHVGRRLRAGEQLLDRAEAPVQPGARS
jgi:hypothetical protein